MGIFDRYALIYCVMLGVPACQGAKRWSMAYKKKIARQLVNSCVIGTTFGFYAYASTVIGTSVGGYCALKIFGKGTAAFTLLLKPTPLEAISDTLFIGFSEAPL